ncbi:DMT family transporter [Dongia mobilis]|jgi:drug/metabolite transporter (DMT)-like permease|uniref:DMT family transporter n=1 Tax=Dongia sp. TaxID=1977262 RepID=UPI0026E988E2
MTISPDSRTEFRPNIALGVAGALVAVLIWGGWIILTRLSVTTHFTPGDIVFLRFSLTALLLAPLLWFRRDQLSRGKIGHYFIMMLGAGAPYMLVAATSMQFAPVAHVGVLMPGTMPLFVALYALMLYGDRLSSWKIMGLGLIVLGDIAVGGFGIFTILQNDLGHAWVGYLLMMLAAAMWAAFTLAQRKSGLDPWMATAVVGVSSSLFYVPFYPVTHGLGVFQQPWDEIVLHGLYQAVGSGILALAAYGIAIQHLGAQRAATFSSLVPALAALLGIPLLGELPDIAAWFGVATVTFGLMLATGAIGPLKTA